MVNSNTQCYTMMKASLRHPISTRSLDGKLLSKVTHETQPLAVSIDSSNIKTMRFHVFSFCPTPSHSWFFLAKKT